jgi:hypothetical protein
MFAECQGIEGALRTAALVGTMATFVDEEVNLVNAEYFAQNTGVKVRARAGICSVCAGDMHSR